MVVMSVQEVVFVWAMNSTSGGNTRLGLMWTCMRLHNRPQVCFPPNLQPEWLLTLVCIFVGCICITTTIIMLALSHWDRNVVPYARWVGFTASMWTCMRLHNRPQVCFPPNLQPEWLLTLVCIFVGCICITTTIIMLALSHWDRNVVPYARWVGFTAIIFPMGFHVDEIGGQPYQLPNSHQVGVSYILFVLALWITVISELFAGKVCLPHF
uniref:Uncharacterized protein n=1 Tax=Timema genevievae TaxID=629358 RepID=A0A7R9K8D2_TIMGE|nr:unnamed protein product [Timema genevievae]